MLTYPIQSVLSSKSYLALSEGLKKKEVIKIDSVSYGSHTTLVRMFEIVLIDDVFNFIE